MIVGSTAGWSPIVVSPTSRPVNSLSMMLRWTKSSPIANWPRRCSAVIRALVPVPHGDRSSAPVQVRGSSGSNTICTVTAAVETGLVPVPPGASSVEVVIDTAVGTVRATAHLDGPKVRQVTVANVPSYVVALDHPLEVPEFGTVPVDIVFGGQFYAQTDVRNLGLSLDPRLAKELARAGNMIKMAAVQQFPVSHLVNPGISGVSLVMLHSGDRVTGEVSRNTVVTSTGPVLADDPRTWTGALDRSPCGTGTSGRMAALHRRGQLAIGEDFVHRSIIDSEFTGRLVGETTIGDQPAVLPTITGRGWVTGRAQWYLDDSDIFPTGFTVGDIWAPQAD